MVIYDEYGICWVLFDCNVLWMVGFLEGIQWVSVGVCWNIVQCVGRVNYGGCFV